MGLLDDAIREHLELKRRHGADPEEISRQEREALGAPARGEFAQPEPAEPAPAAGADDEPAAFAAGEEERPPPPDEEDPWLVEDLADPDRSEEPEEPDREDVLEETPDFLQETPEHDRLWFEQKPPRDFDWDK